MAYRLVFIFMIYSVFCFSQINSRQDYILKYKDLAIKEMDKYAIPASITLAQGILESNNGNSELAVKSNNHFGIKCHSDWSGKKVYHDDDKDKECFRKYPTVAASYRDHSDFLQKDRYSDLYNLSSNDYKSWAKGLKKAGYATNSKYAQLLIKIIEEENLSQFDNKNTRDFVSKRFYYGGIYGWPYLIGQQFLYKNNQKEFLLNIKLMSSLDEMALMVGYNKLLIDEIGVGFEIGQSIFRYESTIKRTMKYALNIGLLIPYKDKIIMLQPSCYTSDLTSFTPSISIGFLR